MKETALICWFCKDWRIYLFFDRTAKQICTQITGLLKQGHLLVIICETTWAFVSNLWHCEVSCDDSHACDVIIICITFYSCYRVILPLNLRQHFAEEYYNTTKKKIENATCICRVWVKPSWGNILVIVTSSISTEKLSKPSPSTLNRKAGVFGKFLRFEERIRTKSSVFVAYKCSRKT